jgi:hypothetical protein
VQQVRPPLLPQVLHMLLPLLLLRASQRQPCCLLLEQLWQQHACFVGNCQPARHPAQAQGTADGAKSAQETRGM